MTRISTNQFFDTNLYGMQLAGVRMLRAQSELITQKKLQSAADNPSGAVQVLRANQTIGEYDQFLRTITTVRSRLEVTDTVLGNFGNAAVRARELAVQMGNGSLDAGARQSVAKEVEAVLLSMQSLANAVDPDGARMFAGFKTETTPVASRAAVAGDVDVNGNPVTSLVWSYEGDSEVRLTSITEARNDFPTNITGDKIFFSDNDNDGDVDDSVFATMQKLVDVGNGTLAPGETMADAIGDILGRLGKFSQQAFSARADIGARLVEIDATENATENSKLSLLKLKSEIEDVDISEAITRFTQQQTILEAARGSYARIQDLSLFKFL
ncbi:MAG: flagellar hook-associated protein FlgL [Burkholderiales bacterium]|nr:flagellar hook-associated protein FlgL [Burkholderiales bacterium]